MRDVLRKKNQLAQLHNDTVSEDKAGDIMVAVAKAIVEKRISRSDAKIERDRLIKEATAKRGLSTSHEAVAKKFKLCKKPAASRPDDQASTPSFVSGAAASTDVYVCPQKTHSVEAPPPSAAPIFSGAAAPPTQSVIDEGPIDSIPQLFCLVFFEHHHEHVQCNFEYGAFLKQAEQVCPSDCTCRGRWSFEHRSSRGSF